MNTTPHSAMLRESWREWLSNDQARAGPPGMHLVWTFLFCAVLALGFTVLGFVANARSLADWADLVRWGYWYKMNLGVCVIVGYLIHALFAASAALLGHPRLSRLRGWQRTLYYLGIPVLGVSVGWPLGIWLLMSKSPVWDYFVQRPGMVISGIVFSILLTLVLHFFFAAKARQIYAEKQAVEAQLRLLQGQIEPHFLFNTLANVQALIDLDPSKAKQMLEALTDYLRSSLLGLRSEQATLGQELDLVATYLALLKTRMEDRLSYSLAVAPGLRAAQLPPLLLQPLVENAIHHGLEPRIEGGHVSIAARSEGGQLLIEVVDDGMGLGASPGRRQGAGMALKNLRQRLLVQYGRRAGLELVDGGGSTIARLRLPLEFATAS